MVFPITQTQYRLLRQFQNNEEHNLTNVSDQLAMDRTTVTRTVQHLRRKEWIRIVPNKRGKVFETTEDGDKIVNTIQEL
jgi:MarR family.